jgi:hypothetical protein
MLKIGDRIEVTAGYFARYKGVITHLYEEGKKVMVWLDTDSRWRKTGMAQAFPTISIIKYQTGEAENPK